MAGFNLDRGKTLRLWNQTSGPRKHPDWPPRCLRGCVAWSESKPLAFPIPPISQLLP